MTRQPTRQSLERTGTYRVFTWAACALVVCACLEGCSSLPGMSLWKAREEEQLNDMADIEDTAGPMERMLRRTGLKKPAENEDGLLDPAAGLDEYEAAKRDFDAGAYRKAQKQFAYVVKHFKSSPVAEDAQFMVAECRYARKSYSWAQDSYERLLTDFPSSRHTDEATKRLFDIAQYWLRSPTTVESSEIQQVSLEDPGRTPPPKDPRPRSYDPSINLPLFPNLWNRSRPVFDTEGRARQALHAIWEKDPTGELADDALMLEASYQLRNGNYTEADHLLTMLRENFPKSPHLENAYLLSGHVKLMAYEGPAYDDKTLVDAEQLKRNTLQMYPDNPMKDRLQNELKQIEHAKAAQYWYYVEYYRRKDNQRGMAVYCHAILEEYPKSEFADRSRQTLARLGPEYRKLPIIAGDTQPKPADAQPDEKPLDTGPDSLRNEADTAPTPQNRPPRRFRPWDPRRLFSREENPDDDDAGRTRLQPGDETSPGDSETGRSRL